MACALGNVRRKAWQAITLLALGAVASGCLTTGNVAPHVPPAIAPDFSENADQDVSPLPPSSHASFIAPAADEHDRLAPPRKNYFLPVVEIAAMDMLLNQVGRRMYGEDSFAVSRESIRRNLGQVWVVDNDPFEVNQIGHPYQGAMYHNIARSAGLNYWESVAYTFASSALWEIAGETTPPSANDQIASGVAGSFLGEPLFRMANLLIEKADGRPGFGRSLLVALLSPPTAFNRTMFGSRFDGVMPSRDPAYDARFQIGVSGRSRAGSVPGPSVTLDRNEMVVDLFMEYGLPGRPGYKYKRPFDYFTLHVTGSNAAGLENFMTRGLLAGRDYGTSAGNAGVWGLYGSYDYISPQFFRVSTTALSIGTSAQALLSSKLTFQGNVLGGLGYAAAQTLHGPGDEDYHYGVAPQAVASARFVAGDRVSLDLVGRQYYVSDVAAFNTSGRDVILRAETSVGVRLYRRHAVSLRYQLSRRDATYADLPPLHQRRSTLALFYMLLGPHGFGVTRQ